MTDGLTAPAAPLPSAPLAPAPPAPVAFTAEQRAPIDALLQQYSDGSLDRAALLTNLSFTIIQICIDRNVNFTAAVLRPFLDEVEGIDNRQRDGGGGNSTDHNH